MLDVTNTYGHGDVIESSIILVSLPAGHMIMVNDELVFELAGAAMVPLLFTIGNMHF